MAAVSALEMVAAAEPGASSVARLSAALTARDEAAAASAVAALKELSVTALLSGVHSHPELSAAIDATILQDSSPVLTRWLFDLVADADDTVAEFVMQFVPTLTWAFVRRLNAPEPSLSAGVLLHAICERGFGGTQDDRFQLESPVPDLSLGSIYHAPMDVPKPPAPLTANRLRDHDLRSGVGSSPPAADNADDVETSTIGGFRLVRSVLSKFCAWMPKLPATATSNFCVLSIRLCSDDATLYMPFTEVSWDPPAEKPTFFAASYSLSELGQLLVRGLLQAFVTIGCRPVAMAAITALHSKAQQDIEPAILLSTNCLVERMRFDI